MDRLELLYAADDAAERTIADAGGTFHADTLAPIGERTDGYAVGGLAPALKVPYPATRSAIAAAILQLRDEKRAPYVGTWADDATSTVYVDAVVILPNLEDAGIVARTLGESAVWDFAGGRAIPSEDAREPRCAACDAPLRVTVRGHHHSEDGRDVTS